MAGRFLKMSCNSRSIKSTWLSMKPIPYRAQWFCGTGLKTSCSIHLFSWGQRDFLVSFNLNLATNHRGKDVSESGGNRRVLCGRSRALNLHGLECETPLLVRSSIRTLSPTRRLTERLKSSGAGESGERGPLTAEGQRSREFEHQSFRSMLKHLAGGIWVRTRPQWPCLWPSDQTAMAINCSAT